MTNVKENFVTDAKGKRIAVQLTIKDYNKPLEELEDIRMYDEVKQRKEESIPFKDYLKQRQKNNG